jgi:hypothetical protein
VADKDGHPEVFVKDYAALDGLIAQPAAVYEEGDKAVRRIKADRCFVRRTDDQH